MSDTSWYLPQNSCFLHFHCFGIWENKETIGDWHGIVPIHRIYYSISNVLIHLNSSPFLRILNNPGDWYNLVPIHHKNLLSSIHLNSSPFSKTKFFSKALDQSESSKFVSLSLGWVVQWLIPFFRTWYLLFSNFWKLFTHFCTENCRPLATPPLTKHIFRPIRSKFILLRLVYLGDEKFFQLIWFLKVREESMFVVE